MHDLLTDILEHFRLRGVVYCQSAIYKRGWALQFGQQARAVFHIVSAGQCWLLPETGHDPVHLVAGDMIVLPHGDGHCIYDAPDAPLCAALQLDVGRDQRCVLMRWGEDATGTTLVCGLFDLDAPGEQPVFALLPAVLYFSRLHLETAGMAATVTALIEEANSNRPGAQTLLTRLAEVLCVQVLRLWLADPTNPARGWLGALRDPHLASALAQMHAQPEHDWTISRLATAAAMSRSAFAARFTELVGEPPMRYLTRWRMAAAARLLAEGRASLFQIAQQVGYDSEAAFSKAFKREKGMNPSQYRQMAQ
jgi:AraC-like DNA-binding protein